MQKLVSVDLFIIIKLNRQAHDRHRHARSTQAALPLGTRLARNQRFHLDRQGFVVRVQVTRKAVR